MTIPIFGVLVGPRADKQPCPVSNLLQLSGKICYQTRQEIIKPVTEFANRDVWDLVDSCK